MKKVLFFLAVVALVGATACTKTEIKEVEVEKVVEKVLDLLTLNATQIHVANEGVQQPLSFTTEDSWTITCDEPWISFDKTSGSAGSSSVTMTVAKNQDFATRTGRVTLSTAHDGTTKSTVFTVIQSEEEVFNTTMEYRLDYTEQDIEVAFNSNLTPEVKVVEGEWLKVTKTKAAPVDGKIVVHVSKNEDTDSRSGVFTVAAGNILQTFNVLQASQYAAASNATALFLGNVQDMYDDQIYVFKDFAQFAVQFATADGDVTLALNVDPAIEDISKIPAGVYTMDETALHAPGTYSIQGVLHEKYYTTVSAGGKDMNIIDGTVTVSESAGKPAIVAALVDEFGVTHMYSFKGDLTVTDASLGAQTYQADDYGLYNTYFSTKAAEVILGLHVNKPLPGSEHWFSYVQFHLFTPVANGKLPAGRYTYEYPETDASLGYANGITVAHPGTFYLSSIGKVDWESGVSYAVKEGTSPVLQITLQNDGLYTIAVDLDLVRTETIYDENSNPVSTTTSEVPFKGTFKDVYVDALKDSGMHPKPDGAVNFSYVQNSNYYMPFWYGDAFSTGCKAYTFGWNYVDGAYTVQIAVNVKDDDWVFTQNFSRYCNTPFKLGTFPFAATPAEHTLIPVKNYHHIKNTYTGHTYVIVGGSILMDDSSITYDLTVTYNGKTFHVGGGHTAAMYYIRDYSSRTLTLDTM